MKLLLTTLNAKYIHKNLALRWLYVANIHKEDVCIREYTIKEEISFIVDDIIQRSVDVVAFSTYIWNLEQTMDIVKQLKERCDIHIILGGPEVSYESFHLLEQGVDALSLGEGETSFWAYIQMLKSAEHYEVEGIYTHAYPNRNVCKHDVRINETYASPYFLAFDQEDMSKRYFYLETSRGCPYSCEYCLSSTDQNVRFFSEAYIFDVLSSIARSSIRIVKLLDRTFNVFPKRALAVARYMNEHCVGQIFQFEVVAETLSEEMIHFFCEEADKSRFRLEVGVQSFHEPTLKAVGRIQNNARLVDVITRLQSAGVIMHVDLIAGLPYEGEALFQQSFNRLYALHVAEIQLGILKLLKGTKLKQKQDEYDYIYNEHTPYDVRSTKWLCEQQLVNINYCAVAVDKFYNSGRARCAIDTLLEQGLYSDAFSLFYALGERMKTLQKPYQPWHLFALLKALLIECDDALVDGIINADYYRLFKQKPKMFLRDKLNANVRKKVGRECVAQGVITPDEMHHYTHIDTMYYKEQLGIQVIVYSKFQTYPKRWFYQDKHIEEIV